MKPYEIQTECTDDCGLGCYEIMKYCKRNNLLYPQSEVDSGLEHIEIEKYKNLHKIPTIFS